MDNPTVIGIDDVDELLDHLIKPIPAIQCSSCEQYHLKIFLHSKTGQCDECFYKRKKWCDSSPVSDTYFLVDNAE